MSPAKLCDALRNVGGIFGEVLGGKAFGDWSLRPDDGREFAQHGITPYPAPRTADGKDRSDPAVLLEVYEWIRDRDDCDTVILGSGDSDYQVLVDRARARGRRIVLCAFSRSVARELLSSAPLFPLEAELGIQLAEHGDVKVELPEAPSENPDLADDVLGRFVREMYDLENRMNYVGFGMLCGQWILDWGLGWNEHECRRLVDECVDRGIVERHEVFNPNRPDWPTSAVRLVRTNETMRQALGFSDGPAANPVLAVPCVPAWWLGWQALEYQTPEAPMLSVGIHPADLGLIVVALFFPPYFRIVVPTEKPSRPTGRIGWDTAPAAPLSVEGSPGPAPLPKRQRRRG